MLEVPAESIGALFAPPVAKAVCRIARLPLAAMP
jgi:hypothetical protein